MHVILVHNPTAGDEQHDRAALEAALHAAGHVVDYRSTKDSGWEEPLGGRPDLVVVAGGDGTVIKVFKQLAGSPIPATLIPLGTANNIAETLGFATDDPNRLVRAWPDFLLRHVDLGEVVAPWGARLFVESAGGGLLSDLLAEAEEEDGHAVEDKVQRGVELLRGLFAEPHAARWGVELDGEDLSAELLGVEALNVRETGPELHLAPGADAGDGLLDVVLIAPEDGDLLREHLDARLGGAPPEALELTVYRGRELTLLPPAGAVLHVDDDLWPEDEEDQPGGTVLVRTGGKQVSVLAPAQAGSG